MVKMKKIPEKPEFNEAPGEELSFLLWKAELNKELMDFWKTLLD